MELNELLQHFNNGDPIGEDFAVIMQRNLSPLRETLAKNLQRVRDKTSRYGQGLGGTRRYSE